MIVSFVIEEELRIEKPESRSGKAKAGVLKPEYEIVLPAALSSHFLVLN
jgi:hypothetical protein